MFVSKLTVPKFQVMVTWYLGTLFAKGSYPVESFWPEKYEGSEAKERSSKGKRSEVRIPVDTMADSRENENFRI